MAIQQIEGGCVAITGGHVGLYRLIVLKQALFLEGKGMKMTRGPSAISIARNQYGLKGDRAKLVAQVQGLINNFLPSDEEADSGDGHE